MNFEVRWCEDIQRYRIFNKSTQKNCMGSYGRNGYLNAMRDSNILNLWSTVVELRTEIEQLWEEVDELKHPSDNDNPANDY